MKFKHISIEETKHLFADAVKGDGKEGVSLAVPSDQEPIVDIHKRKDIGFTPNTKIIAALPRIVESYIELDKHMEDVCKALAWHASDENPCSFDHHGCCQEHGDSTGGGKCQMADSRKLLKLMTELDFVKK